jgi:hypothetical protein
MSAHGGPNVVEDGLVLSLDAANIKSFRGEPTTNVFTHYGTPGEGSEGNVNVTFSIQGTGTFIRLGYNQVYGGYTIKPSDVVYRYNLGTSGCHYHGNSVAIPAGSYATFSFDYYVSPETTIENGFLANFENYGGGAFGGGISANGVKGVWQSVSFTAGPASSNGTLAMFLYPGGCSPSRFGDTGYILYKNPQVEFKTYKTPFVQGTRGTTVATGGGWADRSGNSNHGELVNGPTYSSDGLGGLVFDGTNDYINGPSISTTFTSNLTAETWIKVTASPSDWVRIVGTGGNGGNRTFGLWYDVNRRLLWQRYGATDPSIYPTSPILSLNTWHHIIATTSGTTHVLYLDGVSIGTATAGGPWTASNEAITIGFAGFHTYTTSNISNIRLYNRGLSASEVLQNYNATKGRFGL